jgi:hypothetical protein
VAAAEGSAVVAERKPQGVSPLLLHWQAVSIGLAVLLVLNILLYATVLRQRVRVSGDREAILATEREQLTASGQELLQLERAASKEACSRSDARYVMDVQLSSKASRMVAIQREITSLAKELKVSPERISYSESEADENDLVRFSISFAFEGQYPVLRDFIDRVESSENFLIVEQVGITGDRSQGRNLRLQVRLSTYFLAPAEADRRRLSSLATAETPT